MKKKDSQKAPRAKSQAQGGGGQSNSSSTDKENEPSKRKAKPASPVREPLEENSHRFPIVGIGASAGGLEALEQFLKNVPNRSGIAFVVIQHLDPTHKGAMVELLQRVCAIPVLQAKNRQKVEPDHVYVIPPNKDMSILHGALHLMPQTQPRGLNLPIDFFFRSLAADQQERSIGVILSGMGSDGTLGLRTIKEKTGAAFVQALTSAKFDSMPRSAIEAGLADVVAPADELAEKIIAYRRYAPHIVKPEASLEDKQQTALDKIFILLRTQTGNDFSLYKRSTIYRRVERRMSLHQIDKFANYVRYLRENPQETELLFKELLIGVTSFFRDPPAWQHLQDEVLPSLLQARAQTEVIRAWVPGCSTGEEAFSIAIVFKETLEKLKLKKSLTLQVFATDLDRDAIERARQGIYPANIAADVSPERLRRFFVQDDRGFRVSKEIREMVVFAPQNIIMDPPFTKLDILSCRNLLIYLSSELQKKLIPLFHYSLNSSGILFLGSAETVGTFTNLFAALDGKTRVYRRLETPVGTPIVDFPSAVALTSVSHEDTPPEVQISKLRAPMPNLQALADRLIVQRFAPATVLTTDKGDILYISGRTGKYLEPPVGKVNWNVFAMAREGLHFELSSAFSNAIKQAHPVTVRGIKVGTNGGTQTIDLTVQHLIEPKDLHGAVMIVIADVPSAPEPARQAKIHAGRADDTQLAKALRELQQAREEIQTTREEMQTSQEELKSTNEELQSTNEELQSSNEELTTSKEEMQSMNEELQTVNQELQAKVDELSRSHNDMKNLLNSTDIATLFLDNDLRVRRFTTPTAKLIKLIPGDAGRPITDIVSELDYADLAEDAREVLRTLVFKEKHVSSRDNRWYLVRIMPYRTLENVIDGVVITFNDATSTKLLESTREQASQLRQMAESLPNLVWGARPDGFWDYLSKQWVEYTGVPETAQLGYGWLDQIHPDDRERVRIEWKTALDSKNALKSEHRIRSRSGAFRWFKAGAVPISEEGGIVVKWYGTSTDVEDLKHSADRLSSVLDGISEPFLALDDDMKVTYFNTAAETALSRVRNEILGERLSDAFPEAAGSALEKQCRKAIRDRRTLSFDAPFERAPYAGWYEVRIYPHAHGISVFFQPREHAPAPASGDRSKL